MKEKAASRHEYVPGSTSTGAIARAGTWYEINHMPKRGITTKEIAEKYGLTETWYEYEGDPRRVNMAEQLIRNQLAQAYRERKVVKMWSPRTGRLVKRDGHIVFFRPDQIPDKQVEYGIGAPDPKKWGYV